MAGHVIAAVQLEVWSELHEMWFRQSAVPRAGGLGIISIISDEDCPPGECAYRRLGHLGEFCMKCGRNAA